MRAFEITSSTVFEAAGLQFHFVVSKDGLAQVFAENDPALIAAMNNGWETEWDSARSVEQGLEWAYEEKGLLPWDKFDPRPMREAKVLYRSVSLPELIDIAKTGKIVGRSNTFNGFDTRRWVFFGDTMTERLLWQGDEIERQASVAMQGSALDREFDKLNRQYEELTRTYGEMAMREIETKIKKRLAAKMRAPTITDQDRERITRGDLPSVFYDLVGTTPALVANREKRRALNDRIEALRKTYREQHRALQVALKDKQASLPVSSVVLETKPLAGALHYSKSHGRSGMGEEDEYGFPSGRVTLNDVTKIHLVKNGTVIKAITPDQLRNLLDQLK